MSLAMFFNSHILSTKVYSHYPVIRAHPPSASPAEYRSIANYTPAHVEEEEKEDEAQQNQWYPDPMNEFDKRANFTHHFDGGKPQMSGITGGMMWNGM